MSAMDAARGEIARVDATLGSEGVATAELEELQAELDAFEGAYGISAGGAQTDAESASAPDGDPAAVSAGSARAAPLNWFTAQHGTMVMEDAVHGDLNKTQTVERIMPVGANSANHCQ
jgi:hypothetical protein